MLLLLIVLFVSPWRREAVTTDIAGGATAAAPAWGSEPFLHGLPRSLPIGSVRAGAPQPANWANEARRPPCSSHFIASRSARLRNSGLRLLSHSMTGLAALDPHVQARQREGEIKMLWTICTVLLVLWALGMATAYTFRRRAHSHPAGGCVGNLRNPPDFRT